MLMKLSKADEHRFWTKVLVTDDDTSCWLWQAYTDNMGYGKFGVGKSVELAHRVSFTISGRVLTEDKPHVLHTCDVPSCVRPQHLYAGNAVDNARDCRNRGRHSSLKMNLQSVREVREMYKTGNYTRAALAKLFNLEASGVSKIISGAYWREEAPSDN